MISIRKNIDDSENQVIAFRALLRVFLELIATLPKAALPANPNLSSQCRDDADRLAAALKDKTPVDAIDDAGRVVLQEVEAIYHSNRSALEDRDGALRDVVEAVAKAIGVFKGSGQRHEVALGKVADEFESLSQLQDLGELRRRLHVHVGKLREAAEEMRGDHEQSVRQFESQVSAFQERLESARKESSVDRLTGMGSRREAEREMRKIPKADQPMCILLFDIEGFKDINERNGTLFGDKLLRAFAHVLKERFSQDGVLFRWGADEFLVVAEGRMTSRTDQCRVLSQTFATGKKFHTVLDDGRQVPLAAQVAFGVAQYTRGESMEELYRRARAGLDQYRKGLRG